MATDAQVTEKEARALAEESREKGWARPSFCKELSLGRFRLDLIHPHPKPDAESIEKADKFLARLREYCETLDGTVIEREARIPDEYVKGLAELGCFGIKIPEEYGGLGVTQNAYNKALMLVGGGHPTNGGLLFPPQAIGVPQPVEPARTPAANHR